MNTEYSKLCSNCIHKDVCEYAFMNKSSCNYKLRKKYCFTVEIGDILYWYYSTGDGGFRLTSGEIKSVCIREALNAELVKEMYVGNSWIKTKELGKTIFRSERSAAKALNKLLGDKDGKTK